MSGHIIFEVVCHMWCQICYCFSFLPSSRQRWTEPLPVLWNSGEHIYKYTCCIQYLWYSFTRYLAGWNDHGHEDDGRGNYGFIVLGYLSISYPNGLICSQVGPWPGHITRVPSSIWSETFANFFFRIKERFLEEYMIAIWVTLPMVVRTMLEFFSSFGKKVFWTSLIEIRIRMDWNGCFVQNCKYI